MPKYITEDEDFVVDSDSDQSSDNDADFSPSDELSESDVQEETYKPRKYTKNSISQGNGVRISQRLLDSEKLITQRLDLPEKLSRMQWQEIDAAIEKNTFEIDIEYDIKKIQTTIKDLKGEINENKKILTQKEQDLPNYRPTKSNVEAKHIFAIKARLKEAENLIKTFKQIIKTLPVKNAQIDLSPSVKDQLSKSEKSTNEKKLISNFLQCEKLIKNAANVAKKSRKAYEKIEKIKDELTKNKDRNTANANKSRLEQRILYYSTLKRDIEIVLINLQYQKIIEKFPPIIKYKEENSEQFLIVQFKNKQLSPFISHAQCNNVKKVNSKKRIGN